MEPILRFLALDPLAEAGPPCKGADWEAPHLGMDRCTPAAESGAAQASAALRTRELDGTNNLLFARGDLGSNQTPQHSGSVPPLTESSRPIPFGIYPLPGLRSLVSITNIP